MKLKLRVLHADERHVEAFKALSHLTRLRIFFYLVRRGEEGATVGVIAAELEVPGPTLSHHLDILRRAGLLVARREERFIFYSVRREMVAGLGRLPAAR